jgi:hypothetical protein
MTADWGITTLSLSLNAYLHRILLDRHEKGVNAKQTGGESRKATLLSVSFRISDFAYWLQPEQLLKKEWLLGDSSPNE